MRKTKKLIIHIFFIYKYNNLEKGVGITIIHKNLIIRYKLTEIYSNFTAEITAILKTVELINESGNIHKNNIILTDS